MEKGKWKMGNRKRRNAIVALPAFLFPFSFFFLLSGCNVLGIAAYKFAGPAPIEARYTPPAEPMLVLVENFRQSSATERDAEMLTRYLIEEFKAHNIAPVVDYDALTTLRIERSREFAKMKIDAIGRAVGAKQILYVDLEQSSVTSPMAGEAFVARGAARVKIVDAVTGETRWPDDTPGGAPVAFQTPSIPADKGGDDPMLMRQKLHEVLAMRIARMFYKWNPENLQEEEMSE